MLRFPDRAGKATSVSVMVHNIGETKLVPNSRGQEVSRAVVTIADGTACAQAHFTSTVLPSAEKARARGKALR